MSGTVTGINLQLVGLGRGFLDKSETFYTYQGSIPWGTPTSDPGGVVMSYVNLPISIGGATEVGIQYVLNLQQVFATNRFNTAQMLLIDNSQCRLAIRILTDTNQTFICPPFSIMSYPMLTNLSGPVITFTAPRYRPSPLTDLLSWGTTRFAILNREYYPVFIDIKKSGLLTYNIVSGNAASLGTGYVPVTFASTDPVGVSGYKNIYQHVGFGLPVYKKLRMHVLMFNSSSTNTLSQTTNIELVEYQAPQSFPGITTPYYVFYFAPLNFVNIAPQTGQVIEFDIEFDPEYIGAYYRNNSTTYSEGGFVTGNPPGLAVTIQTALVSSSLSLTIYLNGTVGDLPIN